MFPIDNKGDLVKWNNSNQVHKLLSRHFLKKKKKTNSKGIPVGRNNKYKKQMLHPEQQGSCILCLIFTCMKSRIALKGFDVCFFS